MKKIITLALLTFAVITAFAQDKKCALETLTTDTITGDATIVISYDDNERFLYKTCRLWLAENVKNYTNIKQLEDPQECQLVVNFALPLDESVDDSPNFISRYKGIQSWKLNIKCKEGRFRIKLSEYNADVDMFGYSKQMKAEVGHFRQQRTDYAFFRKRMSPAYFDAQYTKALTHIATSLSQYIEKAHEDDDF